MSQTTPNALIIKAVENLQAETVRRFEDFGKRLDGIENDIKGGYVTQKEFAPVRNLVFGGVTIILVSFVGMLIYIVGWSR